MKHTPGPWTSQGAHVAALDSDCLVALANYSEKTGGMEVATANARLIAAAPELLEALKSMVSAFHPTQGGSDIYCDAATDAARAAIAKATCAS